MRGAEARRLDVTTASGLAEAAWLDLADQDMVPVLILHRDGREVARWVGLAPSAAELRAILGGDGR